MRFNSGLLLRLPALLCIVLICLNGNLQAAPPAMLRITIVQGEGATNNIRQRTAREPIVEVVDENNKPVSGAAVVFLLPENGAGGVFADGSHRLNTLTDADGRATAHGLAPNSAVGAFRIEVQASYMDRAATAFIHQSNVVTAAGLSGKLLGLLAIGGGVAAGAAVALTHGGKTQTPPAAAPGTGTTIIAASPTINGRP